MQPASFAEAVADVLSRFVTVPPSAVDVEGPVVVELPWELYLGRLLGDAQTRLRRTFLAWNVRFADDSLPIVAVLFDPADGCWHVVRSLWVHAHEAYDDGGAIRARPTIAAQRELVGSLPRADGPDADWCAELGRLVYLAVVGTSRLPLTSLEAPLPAFSLGRLFHDPGDSADVRVKRAEFQIRSTPADELEPTPELLAQLKPMFDAVSLTPYTDFVDKVLGLTRRAVQRGLWSPGDRLDFFAWLARRLFRHLNAYDLITFHHRGANYPDALLTAAISDELRTEAKQRPDWFGSKSRRRAVRTTEWLRRFYRGLAVPDHPTSPGENARVWPEPFPHLPEEQIFVPGSRRRELFPEDPEEEMSEVFRESLGDLADPLERHELGRALYLDRPFGVGKRAGEPDATPLVATLTFSRTVAERWLFWAAARYPQANLQRWADAPDWPDSGLPLPRRDGTARPGVVSLQDAFQTADDVRLLRTARSSLPPILSRLDLPAEWADQRRWHLVTADDGPAVTVYDRRRPWLRLEIDPTAGTESRGGVEFPRRVTARRIE